MTDIKDMITEVRDRQRRIETRLSKFLEANGFDIGGKHPIWDDLGYITIPDRNMSVSEIVRVIPNGYPNAVPVVFDERILCMVRLPPPSA